MADIEKDIKMLRGKGQEKAKKFIEQYKKDNNPGNPEVFHDSTFLYIRSFNGDIGDRTPGITDPRGDIFWLSPDIELFEREGISLDRLQENETYRVEVTVRNSGDLNAYSCTVELYLCDPALGFSLDAPSTSLIGTPQSAEVMSSRTTKVAFTFEAIRPNIGHKCMFARVHSVVYRETPAVITTLDPFHNRHDAQKNLFIVERGELMTFSMSSFSIDNNLILHVMPVSKIPKPFLVYETLLGVKFSTDSKMLSLAANRFIILPVLNEASIFSKDVEVQKITPKLSIIRQLGFNSLPTNLMLKRSGKFSWNFQFEKVGTQMAYLIVPKFQLPSNEAGIFHFALTNKSQHMVGGITLIVK